MSNESQNVQNAVIIGSGPAGYTAAIYLGRAGYKPVMYTGALEPGGALMNTTLVENFPGFPEGVDGPVLMENMQKQAEKFGATFVAQDVASVDLTREDGLKALTLDDDTVVLTKTVIVSTGSSYRHLGVPGEEELGGLGVSYCATCDGFFFRNKRVFVVGGGDSAFTDALFLTRFAEVTLIHRREGFRASQVMVEQAKQNPKLHFMLNSVVTKVNGNGKVESLTVKNTQTGEEQEVGADGVFVAIGSNPATGFLGGQLATDEAGYIVTEGGSSRTLVKGVFAAGDVADPVYRQAISAAGTGCRAALDAQEYLDNLNA